MDVNGMHDERRNFLTIGGPMSTTSNQRIGSWKVTRITGDV